MLAIRAILILLLAVHPAMVVGARSPAPAAPVSVGCGCCDGGACTCGCSEIDACLCAAPEPTNTPLPPPAPNPGTTQTKLIAGLPAGSWPRPCGIEDEPRRLRAHPELRLVRAPLTSCDSAQALLCIWTT